MAQRIKVVGYLNIDDMEPEDLDLSNDSGLSSKGYDEVSSSFAEPGYRISDLEDIDIKLVDD